MFLDEVYVSCWDRNQIGRKTHPEQERVQERIATMWTSKPVISAPVEGNGIVAHVNRDGRHVEEEFVHVEVVGILKALVAKLARLSVCRRHVLAKQVELVLREYVFDFVLDDE